MARKSIFKTSYFGESRLFTRANWYNVAGENRIHMIWLFKYIPGLSFPDGVVHCNFNLKGLLHSRSFTLPGLTGLFAYIS